jgi:hypothetical protein
MYGKRQDCVEQGIGGDPQQSICDLKKEGKVLATFMATHMGAERAQVRRAQ